MESNEVALSFGERRGRKGTKAFPRKSIPRSLGFHSLTAIYSVPSYNRFTNALPVMASTRSERALTLPEGNACWHDFGKA
jgi:hypothetical protein